MNHAPTAADIRELNKIYSGDEIVETYIGCSAHKKNDDCENKHLSIRKYWCGCMHVIDTQFGSNEGATLGVKGNHTIIFDGTDLWNICLSNLIARAIGPVEIYQPKK